MYILCLRFVHCTLGVTVLFRSSLNCRRWLVAYNSLVLVQLWIFTNWSYHLFLAEDGVTRFSDRKVNFQEQLSWVSRKFGSALQRTVSIRVFFSFVATFEIQLSFKFRLMLWEGGKIVHKIGINRKLIYQKQNGISKLFPPPPGHCHIYDMWTSWECQTQHSLQYNQRFKVIKASSKPGMTDPGVVLE